MIVQLLVYNSRKGDISSTYPIPVQYNNCMNDTVQQTYLYIEITFCINNLTSGKTFNCRFEFQHFQRKCPVNITFP